MASDSPSSQPRLGVDTALRVFEVIYGVIFIVGIWENVVVFREIMKKKGRHQLTTNQLLVLHLALADMFILLTLTPAVYYSEADISYTSFLACYVLVPMVMFYHYLRVFTQVTIALERERAIVTPLKQRFSRRAVICALVTCWLASALLTAPLIWDARFSPFECKDVQTSRSHSIAYNAGRCLLQFVVPLAIIAVCYTKAGMVLRRSRFSSASLGKTTGFQHELSRQHNLRACKAFATMVSVFAICTAPLNVICLWMQFGSGQNAPVENKTLYCFIANFPVLFMSFIDPIIYGTCCQRRLHRGKNWWCLVFSWAKNTLFCGTCS